MSEKEKDKGLAGSGLGNILARDLNAIEDLPNYIAPPPGAYKLLIFGCGQRKINDKPVVAVDYVFLELKELNDAEGDKEELAGMNIQFGKDRMSEVFYFDDADRVETTLGVLKKKYGPLGAVLGKTNLLEILDGMKGMTVEATVGRRVDDKDKSKFYPYTRNIVAAV